jgi:hypothetical protein
MKQVSTARLPGYLPLPKSFKIADMVIKGFLGKRLRLKNKEKLGKNKEFWTDFWGLIKGQGPIWKTSRAMNALPDDYTTFSKKIFNKGGSSQQHFDRSIRDISWLEENGQCMDNIKVGQSENPDAGRGAFANRFIPEGGLVAPAPLIHIPKWDYLKMFKPIDDRDRNLRVIPDMDGPMTYQLLLVRNTLFCARCERLHPLCFSCIGIDVCGLVYPELLFWPRRIDAVVLSLWSVDELHKSLARKSKHQGRLEQIHAPPSMARTRDRGMGNRVSHRTIY